MDWTIKPTKNQAANKGPFKLYHQSRGGRKLWLVRGPGMPMPRPVRGKDLDELLTNADKILRPYVSRLSKERERQMGKGSRLYTIWDGLKKRTEQKTNKDYDKYGGRGIRICNQWRTNYMAFRKWALANGYQDDLTLDRRDNDIGYSPDNCHWVTMEEQSNNRSTNLLIEYQGQTKTLKNWTKQLGLEDRYNTIYNRIKRLNWTPERAFETK